MYALNTQTVREWDDVGFYVMITYTCEMAELMHNSGLDFSGNAVIPNTPG